MFVISLGNWIDSNAFLFVLWQVNLWHSSNLHYCSCQMEAAGKNFSCFLFFLFVFFLAGKLQLDWICLRQIDFVTTFKKCIKMAINYQGLYSLRVCPGDDCNSCQNWLAEVAYAKGPWFPLYAILNHFYCIAILPFLDRTLIHSMVTPVVCHWYPLVYL